MENCGIYIIRNKINGKIYVGQSSDIKKRWIDHKWTLLKGIHKNKYLQRTYNKYSIDIFSFELVLSCNIEDLTRHEQEIADNYKSQGVELYNIGDYLSCPARGRTVSEKTRKIISQNRTGKIHSEETKRKMSQSHLGHKVTKETREKLSIAKSGENHHMYGKTHTEEAKKKISEGHMGRSKTEEVMISKPPLARKPKLYAVMGPSGIGKSWVCKQLTERFEYVGYDEVPHSKFSDILYEKAKVSIKPLLIDLCVNTGTFIRRYEYLYDIVPLFIEESEEVHMERLLGRGGKWTVNLPRRRKALKSRADKYAVFRGTSQEVLNFLVHVEV